MGDTLTKLGEAKISPKWHISLLANARPFLKNPKPGDLIEFHLENDEIVIRKKES